MSARQSLQSTDPGAVSVMLAAGVEESKVQSEQVAGPKLALYLPAPHCEHAPPFSPVYPGIHSQEISSAFGLVEHDSQLPDPMLVLYVPAPHCEHVSPFSPVYPALHLHAVFAMLPATDIELEGQSTQLGPSLFL